MSAQVGAGKVAWRRYAMILAPSLVLAGGVVALTGQGALAASFAVSGDSFKLSADTLDGTGFTSYSSVDSGTNGANHPVTPSGFKTAELGNICQSVVSDTPFGKVMMKLTAGAKAPVKATNLVADFDQLSGDIVFTDYQSGIDASTMEGAAKGPVGGWGQTAAKIHIDNLKQRTWSTTAGSFALQGLSIDVSFVKDGSKECF